MPIATPFHQRTSALCTSMLWKEWAGYHAVRSFDTCHEREYMAFRHATGVIDVTALYKYEVTGPDAADFLSRVMVKDIRKLKVGRVTYLCWCDDDGKVVDDGTVTHLDDGHYRVTAAEPSYSWLMRHRRGYDVTIEDSSERLGALAVQGPTSREVLRAAGVSQIDDLKFFGATSAQLGNIPVHVTRTGYTGDIGYEVWIDREHCLDAWDAIMESGKPYRIEPAGLDSLDVTRVEAGFIMNGVDYFSAHQCVIDSRKSTPYELGLGWTIDLERDPFIGQQALKRERRAGPAWALVGLVYDWDQYEAVFAEFGLPPSVPAGAWRTGVPVYDGRRQVGYATSGAWSPTLKKLLALASVDARCRSVGTELRIEVTAEYQRRQVTARVTKTPFFNPERKRS